MSNEVPTRDEDDFENVCDGLDDHVDETGRLTSDGRMNDRAPRDASVRLVASVLVEVLRELRGIRLAIEARNRGEG